MKKLHLLACITLTVISTTAFSGSTFNYRKEFENFKNSPRYEAIFNENAPAVLS